MISLPEKGRHSLFCDTMYDISTLPNQIVTSPLDDIYMFFGVLVTHPYIAVAVAAVVVVVINVVIVIFKTCYFGYVSFPL